MFVNVLDDFFEGSTSILGETPERITTFVYAHVGLGMEWLLSLRPCQNYYK